MGKLYLVRHGEVLWNRERPAYCGVTDLELNEQGRRQAERIAARLAGLQLAAIYSSDLRRARQTAAAIAAPYGLHPVADPAFREVDYGDWEGVSEEDVRRQWAERYRAWREDAAHVRIPGGETFLELRDRFVPAVVAVMERHAAANVAIVAHKAANRVFLCEVLGLPPSAYRSIGQDNACLNVLDYEGGRWRVWLVNDTCHLLA